MAEEKREEESELKEKLNTAEKQRDEYLDGWKRAKADFINYKKEEAERFKIFAKFSTEALITELLGVLDSFDLSLAVLEKDETAKKGVLLIKNQLEDLLGKCGLKKINASAGLVFQPLEHEAVGEMESDKPAGTIAEEVAKGYILNGRVIRPVRVKLSKGQK